MGGSFGRVSHPDERSTGWLAGGGSDVAIRAGGVVISAGAGGFVGPVFKREEGGVGLRRVVRPRVPSKARDWTGLILKDGNKLGYQAPGDIHMCVCVGYLP